MMTFRDFSTLRAGLPYAGVLIEFCWLFPWVLLLNGAFYGGAAAPLLGSWTALGLMVLGFVTVRWVLARPWPISTARVAVVAAGFTAGLASVKLTYYPQFAAWDLRWALLLLRAAHDALPVITPPVVGALMAALLWWRGIVLGEREFSHFEIDRQYRRGVGWSIFFVLLYAIYGDTRGFALAQVAPTYLLAFFSFGLTALAVARLIGIWQETQADEDQALVMNRHWLLLLLGVVGLILSLAMAVSGIVSVEFRPMLLRVFRPLEPVLEFVFYLVFAVAMVIARVILLVISRLPFRGGLADRPAVTPPSFAELFKDLPPQVVSSARWGMVVAIVALLVLLVALAVVRARRRQKKRDEDERESVWSAEELLGGFGAMWRKFLGRFRVPQRVHEGPGVGAIRAIYRQLLRVGAAAGIPRFGHETPDEYQPRLSQYLPNHVEEVGALTGIYVQVRYAGHQATEEDVRTSQDGLARIKQGAGLDQPVNP